MRTSVNMFDLQDPTKLKNKFKKNFKNPQRTFANFERLEKQIEEQINISLGKYRCI